MVADRVLLTTRDTPQDRAYTLRTHVQNVLTKLGVHSKLEALAFAIRHGKVVAQA